MTRKSAPFDFCIPGDELEQHRIQLEHNLQHTDLSFHLSSVPDEVDGEAESVEYPRHHSGPSPFPDYASLEHHSRENFDYDGHSHLHPWSIHDDDGINPYGAETVSTVAHHASGVTVTAGLARNSRREPSVSGVEYDPERPLQDIMDGMNTTEALSLAARLRSPRAGREVFAAEESDRSQEIARPKLAETLQRVGFSPRRPRSAQATPKPRKASAVSFDTTVTPIRRHASQPVAAQPQLNVQPPTPSITASSLSKMAQAHTREVRQAQDMSQVEYAVGPEASATSSRQPIGKDVANRTTAVDVTGEANQYSRPSRKLNRGRVHLPDVTGLTNAVISPSKATLDRYSVRGSGSRDVEARLVASLNALHVRLSHLEGENTIARRRVRELEYELEQCKRDVVRERTRIMESQDLMDLSARLPGPSTLRAKAKEKKPRETDIQASKYLEVVEEKKALEALISTLRSHLTRVTSDLSSQQLLLEDLRRLRETDALALAEKTEEINQLRREIERLASEIEVLRGVVEEGLNERRLAREVGEQNQDSMESTDPPEESQASVAEPIYDKSTYHRISRPPTPALSLRRSSSSQVSEHFHGGRPASPALAEHSHAGSMRRFIDCEEIERISADLEERRSQRSSNTSMSSAGQASCSMLSAVAPYHVEDGELTPRSQRRNCEPEAETKSEEEIIVAPAPPPLCPEARVPSKKSHQGRKEEKARSDPAASSPPFPRINGDLERLFFSAPRHTNKTCQECRGRRLRLPSGEDGRRSHEPLRSEGQENRDEGADGRPGPSSNGPSQDEVREIKDIPSVEEILERMEGGNALRANDIPPQTVLARVLRDLEDEFTHHKEIYRELAEEYRSMDCVTQAARRHLVADHLRDVIDVIERKGDQITSLYELLTFRDKPIVN